MSDAKEKNEEAAAAAVSHAAKAAADQAERRLGQTFALGLFALTTASAVVIGYATSPGPAILVLAGGTLLGVVGLFWASLRTLSGEAPLAAGLVEASLSLRTIDGRADKKRAVLRALKDIEHEHAIGKLDDKDFGDLAQGLRGEAKDLMRAMDSDLGPRRAKATALVDAHLQKLGLGAAGAEAEASVASERAPNPDMAKQDTAGRPTCPKCGTTNDADAAFCKSCGTGLTKTDEGTNDAAS